MWKLLKYEYKYFGTLLSFSLLLPMIYTLVLLIDFEWINESDNIFRISIPLLFGMFPVIIVAITATMMIKEMRYRKIMLLPLRVSEIGLTRSLLLLIPALFIFLYNFIINFLLIPELPGLTERVLMQIGTYSILFSGLLISNDLLQFVGRKYDTMKGITAWAYMIMVLLAIVILDYILFDENRRMLFSISLFTAGLTHTTAAAYFFIKRKNYLA